MSERRNPWADPDPAWRDGKGRFLPGNPGGPGNPHAREMARLRAKWRELTPDAVFEGLHGSLLRRALAGSFPALRLFLEYMMGRPDKTVDIDELDHHELGLEARRAGAEDAAHRAGVALVEAVPPGPLPGFPPPAGRPEAQWRRVGRAPGRAVPPPPPGVPEGVMGPLVGLLRAGVSPEVLREVVLTGRVPGPDGQVRNGPAGGRYETAATGRAGGAGEGAPAGGAGGEGH